MSDREGTPESRESGAVSPSRSRSFSGSPSRKSEEGSIHSAPENGNKSPAHSRSRSRTPRPRSYSRSRSRSRSHKRYRTRSRSGSRGHRRLRSRSRSRSYSRRRYSRSRSRSPYGRKRSSRHSRSRGDRRGGYYNRSHSRSPMSRRRRHLGSRDNPRESRCLGVFGLSLYTEERDIRDVFERYGPIDEVQIVYDHQTGRSRGFSFVYFRNNEDAAMAKERCTGIEIDGRRIRVDYSITERAHTPTPGIYLGKSTEEARGSGSGREKWSSSSRGTSSRHSWRRSPSPYRKERGRYSRSRTRSRSYSPRRY